MTIEVNNINVESILFSGACFRAIKESDGSITNILKDRVINIKQIGNKLYIKSSNNDNLENIIREYFDLNKDYESLNKKIIECDSSLKDTVNECKNYRILNQDSFEMCISYIISQNNNVKRISNSINKLCNDYGKLIVFKGKEYHLFPTYDSIKNISIEELRRYGVGFRDKYIKDFIDNYQSLGDLDTLDTENALKKLMSIKGIGLKVASCILLFGYKRLDVYPIDTWVLHYMSKKYNIKEKVSDVKKYISDRFNGLSGLVIQYMFHTMRNIEGD